MDPRTNPYTPNAGARPPVLVGRDDQLSQFDVLLARREDGMADKSMLITGLRGVGKTVLLNEFRTIAERRDWVAIEAEIAKSSPFAKKIATLMRRALFQLAPRAKWADRAKRAAGVLKAFSVTVNADGTATAGIDIAAAQGFGDSGDLSGDLTDLFVAVGEAAREVGEGVVLLFDEVQFLEQEELEALIAALHKTVQRQLPITLVGAGLPGLPKLAGDAKSYAERLFEFPSIGALDVKVGGAARAALVDPALARGVTFTPAAVDMVMKFSEGYPYFIQEVGKAVWDEATVSPIDVDVVERALPIVEATLDASFFRVRAERTSDLELQYLRAMAELGPEPHKADAVAKILGRTSETLGPIRGRLIAKGILYTPTHGFAAFTVPHFDRFMVRTYPLAVTTPKPRRKK